MQNKILNISVIIPGKYIRNIIGSPKTIGIINVGRLMKTNIKGIIINSFLLIKNVLSSG